MLETEHIKMVPATKAYVLMRLREEAFFSELYHPESYDQLMAEMPESITVKQWWKLGDFVGLKKCLKHIVAYNEIAIPEHELERFYHSPKQHTLGEMAEAFAKHMQMPSYVPQMSLGGLCEKKGVYLAIQERLKQNDLPVFDRPSQTIADWLHESDFEEAYQVCQVCDHFGMNNLHVITLPREPLNTLGFTQALRRVVGDVFKAMAAVGVFVLLLAALLLMIGNLPDLFGNDGFATGAVLVGAAGLGLGFFVVLIAWLLQKIVSVKEFYAIEDLQTVHDLVDRMLTLKNKYADDSATA